ncbi:hypothetical protein GOQ29_13440 [Clostridium sp. D2Q-14]|uniref:hypothetical protein n=1 Tax=Anaeromonas gelatinilytica TaxID=2683194 RepID=UPI00193B4DE4|nr:hypothetical protein [Anaeromonas gelatinilytica]MBS4536622.1 hypothetical protein [Anaeromonas gelatinilytica]
MKVDMPNEEEIKIEIENIIKFGVRESESFYYYLKNMYMQIGIRYLFRDGVEIIFTILLVSSILLSAIKGNSIYFMKNIEAIYVYLFTVSPILYLTMCILNFINAKQNKTYEIEMTCKYNIYQISAFRMLVFSIMCIFFNFFFVYIVVYFYENVNYLNAFIISIASLFLFSTIFLFTMTRIKSRLIKHFIILGWIVFNLTLYILKIDFYIQLLNSISIYISLIVAIGSICIYKKTSKTYYI